jgi:hypothetical protein
MPRLTDGPARPALNEPDLDTADRLREGRARLSMHDTRDSEMDIRNLPRATTQDYTWRRPMNLDAPEPRPGYVQRWVRSEFRSEKDNLNWQGKVREGWTPRDPATVPDVEAFFGQSSHLGAAGIRVGGLILMEMPEERLMSKRRAIGEATRRQEQSVAMETDKISREGMRYGAPPIVREEEVRVATGRRPNTLAD